LDFAVEQALGGSNCDGAASSGGRGDAVEVDPLSQRGE
jgi:hypothetical protein